MNRQNIWYWLLVLMSVFHIVAIQVKTDIIENKLDAISERLK